jgi:hypothetical protein
VLKKWECINCGIIIIAFEEDVLKQNTAAYAVVKTSSKRCDASEQHLIGIMGFVSFSDCIFKELPYYGASTLHGEAGFMTEGTVLDSTDSIHEYNKEITEQASEERELGQFLDAMKNK